LAEADEKINNFSGGCACRVVLHAFVAWLLHTGYVCTPIANNAMRDASCNSSDCIAKILILACLLPQEEIAACNHCLCTLRMCMYGVHRRLLANCDTGHHVCSSPRGEIRHVHAKGELNWPDFFLREIIRTNFYAQLRE
jgi:hypothetical protein